MAVSPVAKAQRLEDARGVVQTVEFATSMAPLDPNVGDNLDLDVALRKVALVVGYPQDALRGVRQRDALRAKRQQAEQAQQELATAGEVANIAATAAPVAEQLAEMQPQGTA